MADVATTPADLNELKRLIAARRVILPAQLETVARIAFAKPELIAFGTVKSVAEHSTVSPKSVMRLAYAFGFDSFHDFRTLFRTHLKKIASKTTLLDDKEQSQTRRHQESL